MEITKLSEELVRLVGGPGGEERKGTAYLIETYLSAREIDENNCSNNKKLY